MDQIFASMRIELAALSLRLDALEVLLSIVCGALSTQIKRVNAEGEHNEVAEEVADMLWKTAVKIRQKHGKPI